MRVTKEAARLIFRAERLKVSDTEGLKDLIDDVKSYDELNPTLYSLANKIQLMYDIKVN
jgi:hypothetical protein